MTEENLLLEQGPCTSSIIFFAMGGTEESSLLEPESCPPLSPSTTVLVSHQANTPWKPELGGCSLESGRLLIFTHFVSCSPC